MFPTFQLNVSGFSVCLDPALLQFVKQLPLEAYGAGTNIIRTPEVVQLPLELSAVQTTPTIATPSVIAEEAQDSIKPNFLSYIKSYATKVRDRVRKRERERDLTMCIFLSDKDKAYHLGVPRTRVHTSSH